MNSNLGYYFCTFFIEFSFFQKKDDTKPETAAIESRDMYAHVKQTGDLVKIGVNKGRPDKFKSKEEEDKWEKSTAKNATLFKKQVEAGKVVPEEVQNKLELKENRTPEEESALEKSKFVARKMEKVLSFFAIFLKGLKII